MHYGGWFEDYGSPLGVGGKRRDISSMENGYELFFAGEKCGRGSERSGARPLSEQRI